jgi:cbb3-type cytochrome c oxidase subunit III
MGVSGVTKPEPAQETAARPYPWTMFAALTFALVAVNIAGIFQLSEQARVERAAAAAREQVVRRGAAAFASLCARCHGGDGKGSNLAPSLNDKAFLASVSDDFLRHTIAEGRPRTLMPAWGQDYGGPLTAQEIDQVVAFMRNWEKPAAGRTTTVSGLPADSVEGGRETYALFCEGCHGDDGKVPVGAGRVIANSPERLRRLTEADLRNRILNGGDEMPALGSLLSPAELDGLIKFIYSWPR